ncbi:MAG: MmcQ/YjbR family DNA-binding protein [Bacteroidota bacterium]
MISIDAFRKLALSYSDVIELPHFEKTSFRVNKKIFATLSEKENIAMLKLSLVDQSVFCDLSDGEIYPVPGGWGKQGATYFDFKKVKMEMLKDAMTCSYNLVASKK